MSTISMESPTLMRAWRLDSIGSAMRMSRSPARPITLEPLGRGYSRPASGPDSTRISATAAPRDSERVAYSVEEWAMETTLRSEERRVGKECRSRGSAEREAKKGAARWAASAEVGNADRQG